MSAPSAPSSVCNGCIRLATFPPACCLTMGHVCSPSNLPPERRISRPSCCPLRAHLRSLGRLLVAYSGGVDSGFLAWAAHRELGADMMAVLADSPSLARSQMRDAMAFAEEHGSPDYHRNRRDGAAEYLRNDAARCFHCKDELFTGMEEYRQRLRIRCHSLRREPRRSGRLSAGTKRRSPASALRRRCWMRD